MPVVASSGLRDSLAGERGTLGMRGNAERLLIAIMLSEVKNFLLAIVAPYLVNS